MEINEIYKILTNNTVNGCYSNFIGKLVYFNKYNSENKRQEIKIITPTWAFKESGNCYGKLYQLMNSDTGNITVLTLDKFTQISLFKKDIENYINDLELHKGS